jgi:hypothetical protein
MFFTEEELNTIDLCAHNETLENELRVQLFHVLGKCRLINVSQVPQVMITIDGGVFIHAVGDTKDSVTQVL